jgi:phosphate:Na+ symporter
MLHTLFNVLNTMLFFPFVRPFAQLVTLLVRGDDSVSLGPYRLEYASATLQDSPELNLLRAEKEIRDMAGIVDSMFERFRAGLSSMKIDEIEALVEELRTKEIYADQMREELSKFLIECTRSHLNHRSERRVALLMRIVADLEDMTDHCYALGLVLQRSVRKKMEFKKKDMEALSPYVLLVRDFLSLVKSHLGQSLTEAQAEHAAVLENQIDQFRDKLKKLARKRIEAGADVRAELLFIDLVRRIEKLGDYAFSISEALHLMNGRKEAPLPNSVA